jgi:hypothetical protein
MFWRELPTCISIYPLFFSSHSTVYFQSLIDSQRVRLNELYRNYQTGGGKKKKRALFQSDKTIWKNQNKLNTQHCENILIEFLWHIPSPKESKNVLLMKSQRNCFRFSTLKPTTHIVKWQHLQIIEPNYLFFCENGPCHTKLVPASCNVFQLVHCQSRKATAGQQLGRHQREKRCAIWSRDSLKVSDRNGEAMDRLTYLLSSLSVDRPAYCKHSVKCTDEVLRYCSSQQIMNDHCCCDHSHGRGMYYVMI